MIRISALDFFYGELIREGHLKEAGAYKSELKKSFQLLNIGKRDYIEYFLYIYITNNKCYINVKKYVFIYCFDN